jgi:hypothetical protein
MPIEPQSQLSRSLLSLKRALQNTSWPPDIFAALYDVLAIDEVWMSVQDLFINPSRNPLLLSKAEVEFRRRVASKPIGVWEITPEFRQVALEVVEAGLAPLGSGPAAPVSKTELPLQIAWLARSIDATASGLSLYGSASVCEHLQAAWDLLNNRGSLAVAANGLVLPAAAKSHRGNSPRRFFANLLRIGNGPAKSVNYGLVSSSIRCTPGVAPVVGFAPVILRKDEVVWGLEKGCFTVGICSKQEDRIIARTIKGLNWLVDNGADVLVLPELVSSSRLRERIATWLRMEAASKPFLTICGSEAVPSDAPTGKTNRGFVLGALGRTLWTQNKHHQYALSSADLAKLDLVGILGASERNEVGTSASTEVVIRDVMGTGRFCLLICEDFAREKPGLETIKEFEVDTCLVIVMDGEFLESGWRKRNALNLAQEPGSKVAIANSRALLARARSRRRSSADLAFYCLPNHELTHTKILTDTSTKQPLAILIAPTSKV